MADSKQKVVTLICERSCDLDASLDATGHLKEVSEVSVVKFPCSGMIQPLMIEAAMKSGATGVIVTGCQIGDCYFREGNRMIRERLIGDRPPGLKKTVDRKRVIALWLSRPQTGRFISEAKSFVAQLAQLPAPAPALAPATAPAAAKPAAASAKTAEAKKPEKKSESTPESGGANGEGK
jgi:coenzyme F420-reducing hydrogenase delta subunit